MAHCLASCESLISSSFAYAEPAAITAAVLSIVPVRNLRIPFLPVTLTAWLLRCGQAQAVRSRHRALAWERVSGSVSQPSRYEDHSSRVPQHGIRRSDGTP